MKHTIVFHLINLAKKMRKAIGVKHPFSFSYSQSSALLAIDSQKEISQREIAEKLHLEPATVVALIDELERENLVVRKPTVNDRRKYQIVLTQKGKGYIGKIRSDANGLEEFIVKNLGKAQTANLFSTLEKVSSYIDLWYDRNQNRKEVIHENASPKRPLAV